MLKSLIPRSKDAWLIHNKSGIIHISRTAMSDLIFGCTYSVKGIKTIRTKIRIEDNGIWIVLFCELMPGHDITQIIPSIESAVIEVFQKYCEIDVKEVKVLPKSKRFLAALLK